MSADFTYPTSAKLELIEADYLSDLMEDDDLFEFFPVTSEDTHLVKWDQWDNYFGLQQIRGLNGEPPKVRRIGLKSYQMVPGTYGEFEEVDEKELTERRRPGTFGDPTSIEDLVVKADEHLLGRELDRIRNNLWVLLTTGTVSVLGANGATMWSDAYTTQTFTAGVTWATSATATPLANFRAVQLLSRGHSVSFDQEAVAYMNRVTFNRMVSNTNQNDLAGRRVSGLLSVLNLEEINKILLGEGLPEVRIYDKGYYGEDGTTFNIFIPDGKVVVIGRRPNGAVVGEYVKTRNVNNPTMAPGSYTMIDDSLDANKPPRKLTVHRGHNGGIKIYFPSAVVQMNV